MPSPASSETLALVLVAAGAGTGAMVDVFTRRIPNAVTLLTAAGGLGLAAAGLSGITPLGSVLGFFLGMLLMLPGHKLGATGAGDVKLMGAVGAVLGPQRIVTAFLLTAIAGGVLALGFAWRRGRLRKTVRRTAGLMTTPALSKRAIDTSGAAGRFPYGPAIAAGSVVTVLIGG